MMPRIERLDPCVALKIAAGEVIERPVSAVKELVENSLDAGAHDIRIMLEQGGKSLIVVEDDGDGIAFEDLPLAIERNATSKIRTLDDLERVATLGYRGEALASMAEVSRLEIRSRRSGADEGGLIRAEAGAPILHSRVSCAQGTRVQAADLFFNLPARMKFLKSASAELKRVVQLAQELALVRPDVRFRVHNDGRQVLDAGGGQTTDEVLDRLWGEEGRRASSSFSVPGAEASVWWNFLPGSKRLVLTAFVNGRRVQDQTIRAALNSTGAAVSGEWAVMLSVPPEDVDVNIHPAKAEVRFRKTAPIFDAVRRAAESAILKVGGHCAPEITYEDVPARFDDVQRSAPSSQTHERPQQTAMSIFAEHAADTSSRRRYLGQTQGGYLVFDDPRGLCLLDAHAAHERILYERIEDSFSGRSADAQRLAVPQELPPALAASTELNRDALRELGFTFAFPSDSQDQDKPLMLSLPAIRGLGHLSPIEMLRSALKGIEVEQDPSKRDREVWWRWARTACRDAVKLGCSIMKEEAVALFEQLERCRTPYSCPHGRPTAIFLAGERLKSWFER